MLRSKKISSKGFFPSSISPQHIEYDSSHPHCQTNHTQVIYLLLLLSFFVYISLPNHAFIQCYLEELLCTSTHLSALCHSIHLIINYCRVFPLNLNTSRWFFVCRCHCWYHKSKKVTRNISFHFTITMATFDIIFWRVFEMLELCGHFNCRLNSWWFIFCSLLNLKPQHKIVANHH